MAYATASDIQNEFKNIDFSVSGSSVATAEVSEFISQAEGFINAKISNKYLTPVTGSESVKILKNICIWMVTDRVKEILKVKNVTEDTDQGVREGSLYKRAMDMLKEIASGTLPLPDATAVTTSAMKSYASDNNLEYTFKKSTAQW